MKDAHEFNVETQGIALETVKISSHNCVLMLILFFHIDIKMVS